MTQPLLMFIDAESSDLIRRDISLSDPQQPWAVTVAAMLCTPDGVMRDHFHIRVRAEGRKIRQGAEAIHGVSSREAGRTGVSEVVVLGLICGFASQAVRVVAHSMEFEQQLIESLLLRRQKPVDMWSRPGLEFCCTMKGSAPTCKIEPKEARDDGGYKWPTLDEAAKILLGEEPREGKHNSWDDMLRASRVYFELVKRGVIEPLAELAEAEASA